MSLLVSITFMFFWAVCRTYGCEMGTVRLDYSQMGLTTFPDLTKCASTLQTLYLSNNDITSIPPSVGNLTVLRELRVDGNQLVFLPDQFGNLINLVTLWANFSHLSTLPTSFANLVQLEHLDLSYGRFNVVPAPVLTLIGLRTLSLDGNNISALPSQLGYLPHIIEANFSYNPLRSIPAELGNWNGLETFGLFGTKVQCLPCSVKLLPSFLDGNYLPTCTNNTVAGYVVQRARKHGACGGPVRNMTGFATGCIDQVRITCGEQDGQIVVTRDRLSILDSRSLTCQPDSTVLSTSTVTYPRCNEHTGIATTFADLDSATEVPFPHKHPGMVTLGFSDYDSCARTADNGASSRRLTAPRGATAGRKRGEALQVASRQLQPDMRRQLTNEGAVTCDPSTESWLLDTAVTPSYDLRNCSALRDLTIYGYNADVLAQQIPYLPVLESLSLASELPMRVPDNLHLLRRLVRLSVTTTAGYTFPEVIRKMPQLTSLSYTEREGPLVLPEWMPELTNLHILDLSGNRFHDTFPTVVTQLVNLRNLSLQNTGLASPRDIPASLTKLQNLRALDLSDNWLGNLPAFLGRTTSLQALPLVNCDLTTLPETLGNLADLDRIYLAGNRITCLPEKVRQLSGRDPDNLEQLLDYPACPPVPLPVSFVHQRNSACLWEPYYEFWYRAACDNSADTLSVTLYADSACRKKAKRAAVHGLQQQFPGLGYCMPTSLGSNDTSPSAFSVRYCHN